MLKDFIAWTLPFGGWGLFWLSFCESSFFPVPPDILLIALSLAKPELGLWFAFVTTIGSTLGGAVGYLIGFKGGRRVLDKFVSKKKIERIEFYFNKYHQWAIAAAGFTPIPYKLFTISAGVFRTNFLSFVVISFLSRGARFFIVGGGIYLFGPVISEKIKPSFNIFTIFLFALLIIGVYLVHKKRNKKIKEVRYVTTSNAADER